jgi:5-formyltetrahydrofolate cyclo-ligase
MKSQIRKQVRQAIAGLGGQAVKQKSRDACMRLIGLPEFQSAATIMVYLQIPRELETLDIINAVLASGKTLLSPVVLPDDKMMHAGRLQGPDDPDLTTSDYGIREPIHSPPWPIEQIDFLVVPGMAFDRHGNRLGRGGGYYDRFLAQPGLRAFKCGLAFEEQLLPSVPMHKHDVPVDAIVTDARIVRVAARP